MINCVGSVAKKAKSLTEFQLHLKPDFLLHDTKLMQELLKSLNRLYVASLMNTLVSALIKISLVVSQFRSTEHALIKLNDLFFRSSDCTHNLLLLYL